MINVIIVDDHNLIRRGISSMLNVHPDITVSGEAESGEKLFSLLAGGTPADLILLDVNLPDGMSGMETARRLRSEYPALKILAISAENSQETVKAMLEAGIDGFISKQMGNENELAAAIRSVMDGLDYFGHDISYIIYSVVRTKSLTNNFVPNFTDREKEVIRLCHDGLIGKEIANHLGIALRTVNTYKERIFQKIGLNSTMEMVNYALKNGIIRIEN